MRERSTRRTLRLRASARLCRLARGSAQHIGRVAIDPKNANVAFVAANPTPWNALLLLTSDIALMARAVCEERTLARDPQYRGYQQLVRWRVLPGVF